jgi:hypothetical protein
MLHTLGRSQLVAEMERFLEKREKTDGGCAMLEKMTQSALCDFIPGKAARITSLLMHDRQLTLKQALLTFYRSRAYRLLEQEETKLWHESPAQIYAEYFTVSHLPLFFS